MLIEQNANCMFSKQWAFSDIYCCLLYRELMKKVEAESTEIVMYCTSDAFLITVGKFFILETKGLWLKFLVKVLKGSLGFCNLRWVLNNLFP